jgi:hypothetical protein
MPADLTTVLGRLLADPGLRSEFRRDPAATARSLDADPAELSALDPEELEHQAQTLVDKRFYEVAGLLPRTMAALGRDAERFFRDHAAGFWPEGHRRHAEDAAAFGRWLETRRLPRSRSELNRLRFSLGGGRFSLGFVDDAWVAGRNRRALQLLYRRRGAVRSIAFYLGF